MVRSYRSAKIIWDLIELGSVFAENRRKTKEITKWGRNMSRAKPIEWPDKAKICVTFIVPWEVWPENFATHESLQRHGGATLPPPKAVFKQNMALVTEREYVDSVGLWIAVDLSDRNSLKVTCFLRVMTAH